MMYKSKRNFSVPYSVPYIDDEDQFVEVEAGSTWIIDSDVEDLMGHDPEFLVLRRTPDNGEWIEVSEKYLEEGFEEVEKE